MYKAVSRRVFIRPGHYIWLTSVVDYYQYGVNDNCLRLYVYVSCISSMLKHLLEVAFADDENCFTPSKLMSTKIVICTTSASIRELLFWKRRQFCNWCEQLRKRTKRGGNSNMIELRRRNDPTNREDEIDGFQDDAGSSRSTSSSIYHRS